MGSVEDQNVQIQSFLARALLYDLMKDFFTYTYSHIFSGKNVTLMITFIWLFSFGMVMLPLFEIWGKLGLNDTKQWCTILPKGTIHKLRRQDFADF